MAIRGCSQGRGGLKCGGRIVILIRKGDFWELFQKFNPLRSIGLHSIGSVGPITCWIIYCLGDLGLVFVILLFEYLKKRLPILQFSLFFNSIASKEGVIEFLLIPNSNSIRKLNFLSLIQFFHCN